MIDKLDLRLPADGTLTREVRQYVTETAFLRRGFSRHYRNVVDLRPIGTDAILHYALKRETAPYGVSHKLEILDAGLKSYSEWVSCIGGVFQGSPDSLALMRLDTCADVEGVPVSWFPSRTRVKYKRSSANIGDFKWQTIATSKVETVTAGKRPNFIRIYDKVAEQSSSFAGNAGEIP